MVEQLGPKKFIGQLRSEAPYFAKLLPELPRLLHDYLRQRPSDSRRQDLEALLAEQRRTNRLLQGLIYVGIGFALGLIAMQFLLRVRLF